MMLLLPLLLIAAAWAAGGDADLDRLMQRLAQRQHGHATYVEQTYSTLLTHPVQSSGELWFDASGRLEKKVLKPKPEDFKLDGNELQIVRGGKTRTVALQQIPELAPLLESLRQTLAGDRAALEQNFELSFSAQSGGWTLTLKPRQPELARNVALIRVSGREDAVREVLTQRPNGDHSLMQLTPVDEP